MGRRQKGGKPEKASMTEWSSLPSELRVDIIRKACEDARGPPDDEGAMEDLASSQLALVSREFWDVATPLLWRHVRLHQFMDLNQFLLQLYPRFSRHIRRITCTYGDQWPDQTPEDPAAPSAAFLEELRDGGVIALTIDSGAAAATAAPNDLGDYLLLLHFVVRYLCRNSPALEVVAISTEQDDDMGYLRHSRSGAWLEAFAGDRVTPVRSLKAQGLPADVLVTLLRDTPDLQSLDYSALTFGADSSKDAIPPLRRLVSYRGEYPNLDAFHRGWKNALRTIELDAVMETTPSTMARLLHAARETLEELRIGQWVYGLDEEVGDDHREHTFDDWGDGEYLFPKLRELSGPLDVFAIGLRTTRPLSNVLSKLTLGEDEFTEDDFSELVEDTVTLVHKHSASLRELTVIVHSDITGQQSPTDITALLLPLERICRQHQVVFGWEKADTYDGSRIRLGRRVVWAKDREETGSEDEEDDEQDEESE